MKKFFISGVFAISFSASAQRPVDIFNYYRDSLQPERIYVHFDKDGYIAEDTIWFKAYLYSGFDISDNSTNFFIKLVRLEKVVE